MESTRLPGKVLMNICGHPMLWHVVHRARQTQSLDQVVVATSENLANDKIASFCDQQAIPCFRGSENDVLDRYYQAAHWLGADVIVRVTADCPFIDPVIIDQIVVTHVNGEYDYTSNTIDRTYPDGLDTEVFTIEALAKAWREAKLISEREHVTPYIWKHRDVFNLHQVTQSVDQSHFRWTVDEPEDLVFAQTIYEYLYHSDQLFYADDVIKLLEEHPEFLKINQGFVSNEGYLRSLKEDKL